MIVNSKTVGNDTPLAMLTLGQLIEALQSQDSQRPQTVTSTASVSHRRYVYGIAGIRSLFNCSALTAQRYKDGIIKDAVSQCGRKIVVDAEKAMELFKNAKQK